MRVLVCGGRDYMDMGVVYGALDELHEQIPISLIIEGGARGADALGRSWALSRCVSCLTEPANWKRYGNRAGGIRNAKMLTWKPDLVVAFPGDTGTENMIRHAKVVGVKVYDPITKMLLS